jgi:hypothetical protein
MRKTIFAILATTALLSTGMFGTRVEAMTPAPLDVAAPNADLVQQSAVVCGPRGCVHRPTPNAGRYGTNGVVAGVVSGTPGMDADLVGRDRVEDARPTDLDGEAGGELTHLLKVEARRIAVINVAKDGEARF